ATGQPFAPQALVQLPQGLTTVNVVPADGTYRYNAQKLLILRFEKNLFRRGSRRLELAAELANALQDKSALTLVSQVLASSTFGQPATWGLPRRLYSESASKS